MPITLAFMAAAQAAGIVVDYWGREQSNYMSEKGAAMQQNAIQKAILYSRIQVEDESYREMVALRQNLGSQAAMFAARGIRPGTPMTALFANESVGVANMDERMRRLNQRANEERLRAGIETSKLNQKAFENENWNAFIKNTASTLSTNPQTYKSLADSFGLNKVQSFKGVR